MGRVKCAICGKDAELMEHVFRQVVSGERPTRQWVLVGALYCRTESVERANGVIYAAVNFCSAKCSAEWRGDHG